jgi:diaminopimelate epimerase
MAASGERRPSLAGVRYLKGHGTENDFVLLPDPERSIDLTPGLVAAICDRHAGLGADGVLRAVLAATDPEGATMADRARWFMDYRNADGGVAEMCGNGIRVFARYLVDAHLEPPGELDIATRDGVKRVRLGMTGDVTVDMGTATVAAQQEIKVSAGDRSWPAVSVDVGNPHAVAFVDSLADAGDLKAAPVTEPGFADGVNVEFVADRGERHIAMRVHERGVGETRSCGTGACAAMAAAAARTGDGGPTSYVVDVPGGRLTVSRRADGQVELTGPAVLVSEGVLRDDWLAAHR